MSVKNCGMTIVMLPVRKKPRVSDVLRNELISDIVTGGS